MRLLFGSVRLAVAVAVVIAVACQWALSLNSPVYAFANFFGYFTIQSNLIVAAVMAISGALLVMNRVQPHWLVLARAAATAYIATTGVVFNVLLVNASLDQSFSLQWASDVMHRVVPLVVVLDWVFFGDRSRIRWSRLWWFLAYPLVWVVVILLRGQSFVPYPFLNVVKLGWGVVLLYCLGIAIFIAGMSAIVIWLSRYRILTSPAIDLQTVSAR
ncbi:Pr6Pr family membrane protein [Frondihabitans australicus]|uniref:FAR-17a/AIG1-like protein n=1 Tax=Frondihabitans australicus TaxID=386892 RepID=A0A495IAR8_9MICO|nr:Pr6Pr family membrane protein [Frondihabitans australicus]RKR73099.1 hypothetical protein C8E83_0185 [Frondihabitans australicus]